jgi:hypothetical protein
MHGFNRSIGVQIKYRQIKTKDIDVRIGFIARFADKAADAKEAFETSFGIETAESIAGCDATVRMIYSITGEKLDPDRHPCSLDVMSTSP